MNLVSFSVYGKMQESGLIEIIFFFFNVHLDSLNLLAIQETQVQSLGQEYPLEKGMATQSSILARIPWTEEPGRLQPMVLQ